MITLRRCALLNALRGKTTIEEVLRVTLDERRQAPTRAAAPRRTAVAEHVPHPAE